MFSLLMIVESVGITVYESYCPIKEKTSYNYFFSTYCCELSEPKSCCKADKPKDCCDVEPEIIGFNPDGFFHYSNPDVPTIQIDLKILPYINEVAFAKFDYTVTEEYFINYGPPPWGLAGREVLLRKQTFLI